MSAPAVTITSVSPQRRMCGVSRYARHLERALRELGAEVRSAAPRNGRIDRTPRSHALLHVEIGSDLLNFRIWSYQRVLSESVRDGRRGVAILHSVFAEPDLRWPPAIARVGIAWQWRTFERLARNSRLVVFSRAAQRRLGERGLPSTFVEHGALDPGGPSAYQHNGSTKRRLPKDRIAVGIVGHPYAAKRPSVAAAAFAALPADVRSSALLALIGGEAARDRAEWRRVVGQVASLPADQLVTTGPLAEADMRAYLDDLDLALLPYAHRGAGSGVLWELLARGVPMLCSDAEFFDTAIGAGAALGVRDWRADGVSLLTRLLRDEDARRTIGRCGRVFANDHTVRDVARIVLGLLA